MFLCLFYFLCFLVILSKNYLSIINTRLRDEMK